MYEQFFGLRKNPFVMAPDPAFVFPTPAHREALAGLTYAIMSRKGFVVLTGEAGTGKTTLLTTILQSIPDTRVYSSFVLNSTLTPSEFLELAMMDFGINNVPVSKAQRLMELQGFLVRACNEGKVAVLIVDEAHKLSPEVLEEIRLLTNFNTADGNLLQIVLAGQKELNGVLNRGDLWQLKQRIAFRLALHPLPQTDVEQYMRHRWIKAGGSLELPFSAEAVRRIGQWSRGIPRLINAICDNALLLAFGAGASRVEMEQVLEVAADLDLLDSDERPERATLAPAEPVLEEEDPPPLNGASVAPEPISLPTLERYLPSQKRSLLSRWVGGKRG